MRRGLFGVREPFAILWRGGDEPEGRRAPDQGHRAFDQKQDFPRRDRRVDLEHPVRNQAGECAGDGGAAVERGGAEREFVPFVK